MRITFSLDIRFNTHTQNCRLIKNLSQTFPSVCPEILVIRAYNKNQLSMERKPSSVSAKRLTRSRKEKQYRQFQSFLRYTQT